MAKIVRTIDTLRETVRAWQMAGETTALVPTMGYLHDAHQALIKAGRAKSDRTVVSIFVNPKQYGPNEDFKSYPRQEKRDLEILEACGADLVFLPAQEEMYPSGFSATIDIPAFSNKLCGIGRPGHFSGVATVCAKLFLQCMPDMAVFGEKDYQQLQIIRWLVKDLNIDVDICGVPTVREEDGLAMSSRNIYLNADERTRASQISAILSASAKRLSDGMPVDQELNNAFIKFASLVGETPEYLELCDAQDLEIIKQVRKPARLMVAVKLGKTRLIDNWPVSPINS